MQKQKKVVYCPVCETWKYHYKFFRNGKGYKTNCTCNNCDKVSESILKEVDLILEGVFIPFYETPVVKYKLAP